MFKRSFLIVLMCLLAGTLIFAACQPPEDDVAEEDPDEIEEEAAPEEEEETQDELVKAMWSAPDGLFHYNLYESVYDLHCFNMVFDGLMEEQPDLSLEPNLAEELEVSEDEKTFYYKLRDDIYFHDGEEVTTEDVKFTFEWMMHEDYDGPRASYWQHIEGFDEYQAGEADEVEGIEIINDREIEFHFSQVDASARYYVSTWGISPKHVFEDTPVDERRDHDAITDPIGTGPFEFEHYEEGQYVEVSANEDYHRGEPGLERIIVRVSNPDVVRADLQTGGVDLAEVPANADDWEVYRESDELELEAYSQNGYQYMGMNNREGESIFDDKAVRQAVTYATDREDAMVEGILDGLGRVQESHMSTALWAFNEDLDPYPYDPEKGAEVLEEAGYERDDDGYWQDEDGERLSFTLDYPSGDEPREQAALVIEQNLSDFGIDIELNMMEFATLSDKVFEDRDFEAYLMGWSLGADPDPTAICGPDARFNAVGFDHPESTELMEKGIASVDPDERKPHYIEWQELLHEEAPYIWLFAEKEAYAYDSDLQNFNPNAFSAWFDVHEWEFE